MNHYHAKEVITVKLTGTDVFAVTLFRDLLNYCVIVVSLCITRSIVIIERIPVTEVIR